MSCIVCHSILTEQKMFESIPHDVTKRSEYRPDEFFDLLNIKINHGILKHRPNTILYHTAFTMFRDKRI